MSTPTPINPIIFFALFFAFIGVVLFLFRLSGRRMTRYYLLEKCFTTSLKLPADAEIFFYRITLGYTSERNTWKIAFAREGFFFASGFLNRIIVGFKTLLIPWEYFYLSDGHIFIKTNKEYVHIDIDTSICGDEVRNKKIIAKILPQNRFGDPKCKFFLFKSYSKLIRTARQKLPPI
jgi:hypothetical protein